MAFATRLTSQTDRYRWPCVSPVDVLKIDGAPYDAKGKLVRLVSVVETFIAHR